MRILAAQALLGAAVLAAAPRAADEAREPPQIFSLEVEGKRIPLELDRPLDLATPSPATRVTLRSEPYRVFDFAGLRFHYPREMGFEADVEDPSVAIWNLDGNDVVVMVHRLKGQEDPLEARVQAVAGLVARYGRDRASLTPRKAALGGRDLECTEIRVSLAGTAIAQEVYSFRSGGDSLVLILQDSVKDDGSHTDEFRRVLDMLRATLRFPGGKE